MNKSELGAIKGLLFPTKRLFLHGIGGYRLWTGSAVGTMATHERDPQPHHVRGPHSSLHELDELAAIAAERRDPAGPLRGLARLGRS